MSWKKSRFATSLLSLLGEPAPEAANASRLQAVRQTMLDCLAGVGESDEARRIWGRVFYASDPQSLWYLRSDLMILLAGELGEATARSRIQAVNSLLSSMLPAAQRPRTPRLKR